ncbi:MAG: glutathione S-transferase family protein [Alphaproteobacteria bacterium]
MSLVLYHHPLASFAWKVLIALHENGTPFDSRIVDYGDPDSRAEFFALAPLGKIPVLRDAARDRTLPETSIIVEYLAQNWPGPVALLPADPDEALEVRLWDRIFDLYVNVPMQKIVGDRLRADGQGDPAGVEEARATLRSAYAAIEAGLDSRQWAAGAAFTMADCAAAPALFYAGIVEPFAAEHAALAGYFERLVARPSVARTIAEARPYFRFFPMRDAMPARFRDG